VNTIDLDAFLKAIETSPDDPTPRLVFADWLEEQGLEESARKIREATRVWNRGEFSHLIGKTLVSIHRADAELEFDVRGQEAIRYSFEGDCCSTSWLFRVRGVTQCLGKAVVAIVEINTDDVNPDDGLGRQESESIYGVGLLMESGDILEIVYRNSSNGYYGGGPSCQSPLAET
jgi:uncharacterized protein (TIGR02996 family)